MLSTKTLLTGLNEEQEQAVFAPDGPLLLLAGPGSGKTRTLIARIGYLIERGVNPASIIAITFTNKAADEIINRLEAYVGSRSYQVMAGTFHSIANRLLRIYGKVYGFGDYRILDDDEADRVIKYVAELEFGDPKKFMELKKFIDRCKNNDQLPSDLAWHENAEEFINAYRTYQSILQDRGYMDFGDLIISFNRMMERRSIRERIHARFKYLLIDEYQDVNLAQYRMALNLVNEDRNIWVVGDPDQAIYSFRGADSQHIINFRKDFPDAQVLTLSRNYRSSGVIIDASNEVISNNTKRLPKESWTNAEMGELITVVYPANPNQEAAWVADQIRELINQGVSPSEIAVLYRTHRQFPMIEEALQRRRVPFRVVGRTAFYDRQEIKDLIAYLRLAIWIDDTEALLRILNVPKRGIGEQAQKVVEQWIGQGLRTNEILDKLANGEDGLAKSAKRRQAARELKELLNSLPNGPAAEVIPIILERSGLLEYYSKDPDAEDRIAHLNHFVELATSYGPWLELRELMDELQLATDDPRRHKRPMVTLMTAHAAKGTEFDYVFVVGLNQNLFPMYGQDEEEERRLFYVAITRPRKKLFLSSPKTVVNRNGELIPAYRSRLIGEIPAHLTMQIRELPKK